MKIYLLGDIGEYSDNLKKMINYFNQETENSVILFLGDNFYPFGIKSVNDIKWNNLKDLNNSIPIWATLGNHDYLGNVKSQIDYKSFNWNMPNFYYKKTFDYLDFFFIDTSILVPDYSNIDYDIVRNSINDEPLVKSKEMIDWLNEEFEKSTNTKIVIGHYPILSFGMYGVNKKLFSILFPIFSKFNVKYYISGHDHNLQIIDVTTRNFSMKQIISGASSKIYPILKNASSKVFSKYGYILINTKNKKVIINDVDSNELYSEDLEI